MLNIIIVGVGGQGTLLASKVLGHIAMKENLDVKLSEVHGMAQRGGSVITHVRMGENVHAPLVCMHEADYVLAFEHLEALRAQPYLKPDGLLITNVQEIMPMPVIVGQREYPKERPSVPCLEMDAYALAVQAGNQRSVNMVLLGALSHFLPWKEETWLEAIGATVPQKTLAVNQRAFKLGRQTACDAATGELHGTDVE